MRSLRIACPLFTLILALATSPLFAGAQEIAKALEAYRDLTGTYPAGRLDKAFPELRLKGIEVNEDKQVSGFISTSKFFLFEEGTDSKSGSREPIVDKTTRQMKSLAIAVEAYRQDRGVLPVAKNFASLESQIAPNYIREVPSVDAWNGELEYRLNAKATGFEFRSAGADRKMNSPDDNTVTDSTTSSLRSLLTVVAAYKLDNKMFPKASTMAELRTVVQPRYIRETPLVDVWKTEFRYEVTEQEARFTSAGSDRRFGTEDDISVWTK